MGLPIGCVRTALKVAENDIQMLKAYPAPFNKLPRELIVIIFRMLGDLDRDQLRLVCKSFAVNVAILENDNLKDLFKEKHVKTLTDDLEVGGEVRICHTRDRLDIEMCSDENIRKYSFNRLTLQTFKEEKANKRTLYYWSIKPGCIQVEHTNGKSWKFDIENEFTPYIKSVYEGTVITDKLKQIINAFYTPDNTLTCLTQGGIVAKWCLITGMCMGIKQLSNPCKKNEDIVERIVLFTGKFLIVQDSRRNKGAANVSSRWLHIFNVINFDWKAGILENDYEDVVYANCFVICRDVREIAIYQLNDRFALVKRMRTPFQESLKRISIKVLKVTSNFVLFLEDRNHTLNYHLLSIPKFEFKSLENRVLPLNERSKLNSGYQAMVFRRVLMQYDPFQMKLDFYHISTLHHFSSIDLSIASPIRFIHFTYEAPLVPGYIVTEAPYIDVTDYKNDELMIGYKYTTFLQKTDRMAVLAITREAT